MMVQERIQLEKSPRSRERRYLVRDGRGMGGFGRSDDDYLHHWVVVEGVDRGNGYQGYESIDSYMSQPGTPESAKRIVRQHIPDVR